MKLSWNAFNHGSSIALGSPRASESECDFLSKSHLDKAKATELRFKLGFNFLHVIESDGRSGGLFFLFLFFIISLMKWC